MRTRARTKEIGNKTGLIKVKGVGAWRNPPTTPLLCACVHVNSKVEKVGGRVFEL